MSSYYKNSHGDDLYIKLNDENFYDINKKSTDVNLPKNFGNKWSDEDRTILIKLLKKSSKLSLDDVNNTVISNLAIKLGRTIGGIKGEIKKIVFNKYIQGISIDDISNELNLTYLNVKSMIKLHLDKDCDNEINLLEKENKLLQLKIDNIKLKNKLKNLIS